MGFHTRGRGYATEEKGVSFRPTHWAAHGTGRRHTNPIARENPKRAVGREAEQRPPRSRIPLRTFFRFIFGARHPSVRVTFLAQEGYPGRLTTRSIRPPGRKATTREPPLTHEHQGKRARPSPPLPSPRKRRLATNTKAPSLAKPELGDTGGKHTPRVCPGPARPSTAATKLGSRGWKPGQSTYPAPGLKPVTTNPSA